MARSSIPIYALKVPISTYVYSTVYHYNDQVN